MERQAKDGTFYKMVGKDEWVPVTRAAKDGTVFAKIGKDEWTPLEKQTPVPQPELEDSRSTLQKAGSFVVDNVLSPVATAIDYTYAPVRQAMAAPAKLAQGNVSGAVLDPLTQMFKAPSTAPTSSEVAEMYGVKRQKEVSPIAMSNPLMASTYENDPMPTDKENVTVYPSTHAGALMDAAVGGEGINLATKGIGMVAKGVSKGAPAAANLISNIGEKIAGPKQVVKASQSQAATAAAEGSAGAKALISGGDLSVEQSGKLFDFKSPESLAELEQWKPKSGSGELLGKKRLQEIQVAVPDLETPPLKYHYSMMENPKAMKELKIQFENLPTASAKKIAAYNQEIVDESAKKIVKTVEDLTGNEPKSLGDSGNDFISSVKDKYHAEKEALGPVFQQIQKKSYKLLPADSRNLAFSIGENSKLGKLMSVESETGRISLSKNTPRSGLSDSEHGVLARVVDDLNDGMTFKELQDTREFLRKSVDPSNPGASAEISKVRSLMLGQLEEMASKQGADVGATFKAYAKNERARESVEKVIGGKIESFDSMFAANPEKVVQKVFSNPNYTKIVGDYVGPEKMQEMAQSYINTGIAKSFDSARGFEPTKLRSWLKSNNTFLQNNLDQGVVDRLNALADYGYYGKRFLDEVNPSGTAASLKAMLEPGSFIQNVRQKGIVGALESSVVNKVTAATKQKQAIRAVNESLGTVEAPLGSRLKERATNATKKMSDIVEGSRPIQKGFSVATGSMRDVTPVKTAQQNDSPQKGPEKWAKDGVDKIIEHDTTGAFKDPEVIKDLLKTKKGMDLFIKASDLKPGSKAMENIVGQLKSLSEEQ